MNPVRNLDVVQPTFGFEKGARRGTRNEHVDLEGEWGVQKKALARELRRQHGKGNHTGIRKKRKKKGSKKPMRLVEREVSGGVPTKCDSKTLKPQMGGKRGVK